MIFHHLRIKNEEVESVFAFLNLYKGPAAQKDDQNSFRAVAPIAGFCSIHQ